MIERYTTPEMQDIFSEENKYQKWLLVEKEVAKAQEEKGIIPSGLSKYLEKITHIEPERVKFYEEKTNHELTAFLHAVWEKLPQTKRFLHFGLTSQDVIDTANALIMKEATQILIESIDPVLKELEKLAKEHKYTLCLGRTHGRAAEPYSLGVRFLSWFVEGKRRKRDIEQTLKEFLYAKISGTVGIYSSLSPEIETLVLKRLGLKREPVPTQVIPRDRYINLLHSLTLTGAWLERIAVNIRLSQMEGIDEIYEPFTKEQTGSSAMPHKRNPVICERISGLARVLRGYLFACYENNALWFERDISHSSVERIVLKDSFTLLHYMLKKIKWILKNLYINRKRIEENLKNVQDRIFSQNLLLALIKKGVERERAYRIIQENSFHPDFKQRIIKNKKIKELLKEEEIERIFNPESFLTFIDYIYIKAGLS